MNNEESLQHNIAMSICGTYPFWEEGNKIYFHQNNKKVLLVEVEFDDNDPHYACLTYRLYRKGKVLVDEIVDKYFRSEEENEAMVIAQCVEAWKAASAHPTTVVPDHEQARALKALEVIADNGLGVTDNAIAIAFFVVANGAAPADIAQWVEQGKCGGVAYTTYGEEHAMCSGHDGHTGWKGLLLYWASIA